MKLAVLADIHANLPALQAVIAHVEAWRPDAIVVAGDVVNRGPCPVECLRLVQTNQLTAGWLVVRGNHEEYVTNQARGRAAYSSQKFEVYRTSYWTFQQLDGNVTAIQELPFQVALTAPDSSEIRVVHASMRGTRDGIYPETTDALLRQKIKPAPPLLCVGHTHRPLIRPIDNTLVVNAGSVGLPFDKDPRASYAQLRWRNGGWQAAIVRLEYDRAQTERDFFDSGFMTESGALAPLILDEFHTARSRLYQWASLFQEQVLTGEVTLEESVRQALHYFKNNAQGE